MGCGGALIRKIGRPESLQQHQMMMGKEVSNKSILFRPEFYATDVTKHTQANVGMDCSNVVHSPHFQVRI